MIAVAVPLWKRAVAGQIDQVVFQTPAKLIEKAIRKKVWPDKEVKRYYLPTVVTMAGEVYCMLYQNGQTLGDRVVGSELLATYLLRKLKGELLGKTVLLPATVVYQARRVVPTLKEFVLVCQHQQVDARVDVTVMMRATGTRPFTDIHRLLLAFYAASGTDLCRCEPWIRLDERPSVEV